MFDQIQSIAEIYYSLRKYLPNVIYLYIVGNHVLR